MEVYSHRKTINTFSDVTGENLRLAHMSNTIASRRQHTFELIHQWECRCIVGNAHPPSLVSLFQALALALALAHAFASALLTGPHVCSVFFSNLMSTLKGKPSPE